MGRLIGTNPAILQQQQHIVSLIGPVIAQIDDVLNKELYKRDTPEKPYYANILSQLVSVIATFSKGFGQIITNKEPSGSPRGNNVSMSTSGENVTLNGNLFFFISLHPFYLF